MSQLNYGTFSVSLGVADLAKSYQFYSGLGFQKTHGDVDKGYVMTEKDGVKIGLFTFFKTGPSGLTFNPKDVRSIVRELQAKGYEFKSMPAGDAGPGAAVLYDPDGNCLLFDQH